MERAGRMESSKIARGEIYRGTCLDVITIEADRGIFVVRAFGLWQSASSSRPPHPSAKTRTHNVSYPAGLSGGDERRYYRNLFSHQAFSLRVIRKGAFWCLKIFGVQSIATTRYVFCV